MHLCICDSSCLEVVVVVVYRVQRVKTKIVYASGGKNVEYKMLTIHLYDIAYGFSQTVILTGYFNSSGKFE